VLAPNGFGNVVTTEDTAVATLSTTVGLLGAAGVAVGVTATLSMLTAGSGSVAFVVVVFLPVALAAADAAGARRTWTRGGVC
jgi:hypothetical protein